jgi:hypothetical protein
MVCRRDDDSSEPRGVESLDGRLKLADSAVRHQRQKEMSVSDDVRPNVACGY